VKEIGKNVEEIGEKVEGSHKKVEEIGEKVEGIANAETPILSWLCSFFSCLDLVGRLGCSARPKPGARILSMALVIRLGAAVQSFG